MEHTTADIASITLPADDGEIRAALAQLEQQFAEYHSAIRQFHERMPQQLATGVKPASLPTAEATSPKSTQAEAKSEKPAVPVARAVTATDSKADAAKKRPDHAESPKKEAASTATAEVKPSTAASSVEAVPAASASLAEKPPAPEAGLSEEALLASLDPETAQAIRVMRRLSPVKKTVQEWIDEYKAQQAEAPAARAEKKKSWFQRGR